MSAETEHQPGGTACNGNKILHLLLLTHQPTLLHFFSVVRGANIKSGRKLLSWFIVIGWKIE